MALENLTIDIKFKINNKALDDLDKRLDKIANSGVKGFQKVELKAKKTVSAVDKVSQSTSKLGNVGKNAFNRIDTSIANTLTKMNRMANVVAKPFKSIQKSANNVTTRINRIKTGITQTVSKSKSLSILKGWFDKASTSADKLKAKITGVNGQINNTKTKGVNGFGSITGSIFKGGLALQAFNAGLQVIKTSISGIIKLTDKWTNTTARLNLLTGGNATATGNLKDSIFKAAQNSRGDYGATADTVAKIGLLGADAFKDKKGNLNTQEIVDFTELLNKQFTIAGADTMQKESGLLQLTQALAAGKLQGDEFRSIMENAPMLADAIAKYTGKSKGELKEMSRDGEITADIIKKALFASADDINEKFNSMPMTFGSAWTKIKNEAEYSLQGVLNKVNGVLNSDFGKGAINGITNSVKSLIGGFEIAIEKLGEFGSWIGSKISPYAEKFKIGFDEMKAHLSTFWESVQPILAQWKANFAGIFEKVIPLIQRLWNEVLVPFVDWFVNIMWPVLKPIVEAIGNTFKSQFDGILQAIDGLITALSGVIDFLTGVFTGDWQLAWDGIKGIFSGVWEALKGIAKGALNGVIDMINGFIGSLNIQIPNWIPEKFGGGKTFSLPKIPNFEKGTNNTPDTFIAGEKGPELITNAPNRTVYTADETQDILGGNGAVYNNTFNFNITSNNPDEVANKVRSTIEDIFGSISRKKPRLREV